MNKKMLVSGISLMTILALTGCNSSSSSESNGNSNTTTNSTKTTSQKEVGYFIDAAVAGLDYNTSSGISGTTDKFGRFEFKSNDSVTFSIGKLVLGEVKPKGKIVTPNDIVDSNETATKVLQILQTLDSDGNTTNGIEITKDIKAKINEGLNNRVKKIDELKGSDAKLDDEDIINSLAPIKDKLDKDNDGKIDVDTQEALSHFKNSLEDITKGKLPDGKDIDDKEVQKKKEEIKKTEEKIKEEINKKSQTTQEETDKKGEEVTKRNQEETKKTEEETKQIQEEAQETQKEADSLKDNSKDKVDNSNSNKDSNNSVNNNDNFNIDNNKTSENSDLNIDNNKTESNDINSSVENSEDINIDNNKTNNENNVSVDTQINSDNNTTKNSESNNTIESDNNVTSSDNNTSSNSETALDNNQTDTEDVQTGQFIDSAVAGLEYNTTSGINGTTDANGYFNYHAGDKVTFKIGKLVLGSTELDDEVIVTPNNISDDEDVKTEILQLLQTLDEDGNASNGITISQQVTEELKERLDKHISLKELKEKTNNFNDEKLIKELKPIANILDKDFDSKLDINKTKATKHFKDSLEKIKNCFTFKNKNSKKIKHDDKDYKFNVNNYEKSNLTDELKNALKYMGDEERLAYDVYIQLYNNFVNNGTEIKQLANIATRSETKHIDIVKALLSKYEIESDINATKGTYSVTELQTLYNQLIDEGESSKIDALKVGCKVEVKDINDLDNYIELANKANAQDLVSAFTILRDGSYNHYWAFDKALKAEGVEDGCCSLGDDYCKTINDNTTNISIKENNIEEDKNNSTINSNLVKTESTN